MPVVIATKGAANANSYATVEAADAYFDATFGADEWAQIPEDDKARLLLTATRMIDQWSLDSSVIKMDDSQALNFPVAVKDHPEHGDGFNEAAQACTIQAFHIYQNNDTIREAINAKIQGVKH